MGKHRSRSHPHNQGSVADKMQQDIVPGEELLFLPLGGAGEIGMNLGLYGCAGQWLMVDCGIGFGDDTTPGIDIMIPDPGFIANQAHNLLGLVLTHAHEDHFGAIPYVWDTLGCPVFATPFASAVLRHKLKAMNDAPRVDIRETPCGGSFDVGPFRLQYINLTHSIPEAQAVMIRTDHGSALHTGDWKIDDTPLIGPTTDVDALCRCEGVDALVCDSTNALAGGSPTKQDHGEDGGTSESDVRHTLIDLVKSYPDVRVVATCFASNIARLESLAQAAQDSGRVAVLVGRSLQRFAQAALECGYLSDVPPFANQDDIADIPANKTLLICTGCQGEPRAALPRIASDTHPAVTLAKGDVVIFASRVIPGNEQAIGRTQNRLASLGVEVITEKDHKVHVSGHPGRADLSRMYQWIEPNVLVPVHGEPRHLRAQADFAQECGIAKTLLAENGVAIRLAPGPTQVVAHVGAGRLARHGERLMPMNQHILRQRQKIASNGSAFLTLTLDQAGDFLADPVLCAPGLLDSATDGPLIDTLQGAVRDSVERLSNQQARNDHDVIQAARGALGRKLYRSVGLRPWTEIQVTRIDF